MEALTGKQAVSTLLIRWVARIWSVASILIFLLLCVGEGIHYTGSMQWLGFLFYPVGVSIGMILAWKREGLGGSITTVCLIVYYIVHFATAGILPMGWGWLVLAAPGFLFLLCGFRRDRKSKPPVQSTSG